VVSCKTRSFNLSIEGDRLRFVLQLYNLASALDTESGDERTKVEVQKIKAYVDQLGKKHGMETFASRKRRATHDSDGENQHSAHRKRGDGGAVEQLEGCGYEVVPDVFETDGGTWESITKVQHRNHFSIHDVALTIYCLAATTSHLHGVSTERSEKD
jgi:hypothetical protein